jgi:hypothetical protein
VIPRSVVGRSCLVVIFLATFVLLTNDQDALTVLLVAAPDENRRPLGSVSPTRGKIE